jgi:hypothetical protein
MLSLHGRLGVTIDASSHRNYISSDEKKAIEFLDMVFDTLPEEKQNEIKHLVLTGIDTNNQSMIEQGIMLTLDSYEPKC